MDDEIGIRELIGEILTDEGYAVIALEKAEQAWKARVEENPSLVLLDIWMPELDGITMLKQWNEAGLNDVPVIIMSGHATIDTAVEAMKLGAREVLEKPIAINRLLTAVQSALNSSRRDENYSPVVRQASFGKSAPMVQLKNSLMEASTDSLPTLFFGLPNSGFTFFAQFLCPPKKPTVFIYNNSELETDIQPILRQADGGVIIVHNINFMSAVQQSGLLGLAREAARMDVRIIACSVESPSALKNNLSFNNSLVNIFSRRVVMIPPLSQCMEDLPEIITLITKWLTVNTSMEGRLLTPQAINLLSQHKYENDFSELLAILRSAIMHTESNKVDVNGVRLILDQFSRNASSHGLPVEIFTMNLRDAREIFEREYFRNLMQTMRGNMQQAAQVAGLERTYFYRKLKQYKEDS